MSPGKTSPIEEFTLWNDKFICYAGISIWRYVSISSNDIGNPFSVVWLFWLYRSMWIIKPLSYARLTDSSTRKADAHWVMYSHLSLQRFSLKILLIWIDLLIEAFTLLILSNIFWNWVSEEIAFLQYE